MSRQSTFKRVRHAVTKEKHKVILKYMRDNWDVVLNSSVSMLKTLSFTTRLRFAIDIILGKKKKSMRAFRGERKTDKYTAPGHKDTENIPPRPDAAPPPQKPVNTKSGLKADQ